MRAAFGVPPVAHDRSRVPRRQEPGTAAWFALRTGPTSFAIFDVFPDEESRQAHLNGEIAKALMANADTLLAKPPQIHQLDVIASTLEARPQ